jgi:hypothetical protein
MSVSWRRASHDGQNIHFAISTFVDEFTNRLEVRVAISDERLNDAKHLNGRLSQTDEDTIIDLKQTEKLQSLALLWVDLVDTLDTDDERELGLSWNIEGTILLRDTSKTDALDLCLAVLLDVLFGTLEDDSTLLLVGLENLKSASLSSRTCSSHKQGDDASVPKDG